MLKITFYYNDGSEYEKELTTLQEVGTIECGVLRGLYSIALDDPENFKKHFVVGYKLENDKGELIDSHIYRNVEKSDKKMTKEEAIAISAMKNLKHLEILIKQHHTEVIELKADTSGECPVVYIYYNRGNNTIVYSKLHFMYSDDPLNLYRRILDDIIEQSFVANNALV